MCGRYTLHTPLEAIVATFNLGDRRAVPFVRPHVPRYNIAPTQLELAVRQQAGGGERKYLGLAPMTRQSGNRCYQGHITTKCGSSQLRGLMTQAARHALRHPGPLGAFFRRLTKRKNRSVAITALAWKLVTIAYLMLKNNEPYRYARSERMQEKFTKLKTLPPSRILHRSRGSASTRTERRAPSRRTAAGNRTDGTTGRRTT